mmetsp:Transcript_12962/g.30743  ORF Transcript_12962/g.30743 Transcript_12962/m.30743 type:complete len:257 (+) Transcript_12962:258-1028(+)
MLGQETKPNAVILHTDVVIRRRQCVNWAKWYLNGEKREYPEFDIFGPFLQDEGLTRGSNPEEWTFCAKKISRLKLLQSSGNDVSGNSLRTTRSKPQVRDQRLSDTEQRLSAAGRELVCVSLPDCQVCYRGRTTGRPTCTAYVKTYGQVKGHSPNTAEVFSPRPFYKDYRHYSRYGFAGHGAKSAWAHNPKQTADDYEPVSSLYTKQRTTKEADRDDKYVHVAARCDERPRLSSMQRRLLHSFPDHRTGAIADGTNP